MFRVSALMTIAMASAANGFGGSTGLFGGTSLVPSNNAKVTLSTGSVSGVDITGSEAVDWTLERGYRGIPQRLQDAGAMLTMLPDTAENEMLTLACESGSDATPCTIYVLFISCPDCRGSNGGLPAELLSEGFQQLNCGPTYTSPLGDFPTIMYKKEFDSDSSISFTFTKDLAHVGVFTQGSPCSVQPIFAGCSGICTAGPAACIETPLCPPKPAGPFSIGTPCQCPANSLP